MILKRLADDPPPPFESFSQAQGRVLATKKQTVALKVKEH